MAQPLKVTQSAVMELRKLVNETGHQITPDDMQDICDLAAYAQRLSDPFSDDYQAAASLPKVIRGWPFHPLTIGKLDYWQTEICERWGMESTEALAVFVWLLSIPNDAKEIRKALESAAPSDVVKQARHLWRFCPVRDTELRDIMAVELANFAGDGTGGKEKDGEDNSYGPMLTALAAEYHQPIEYFVWTLSGEELRAHVGLMMRRADEEISAAMKAGAKIGMFSGRLRIIKAYRDKVNELRTKWQRR